MKNDNGVSRAVVLLSGGLDSTTALAMAAGSPCAPAVALFFDYGQRAARREESASRRIAEYYRLAFERIDLPWLARISSSLLIEGTGEPPAWSERLLEDRSARDVWVENRNGIFIGIAVCLAAETGCDTVIVGFNREEAAAFPDNSEEFLSRTNSALELGLMKRVRVESPTLRMDKREIARRALELGIPWEHLWSCYGGPELMCGSCESCLRLSRAVAGTPAERLIRMGKERG